jgi:signal transduction histidine kinase
LRFMRDAGRSARADAWEQMAQVYVDHLRSLEPHRDAALSNRFPLWKSGQDAQELFLETLAAGGAGLVLVDEAGNRKFPPEPDSLSLPSEAASAMETLAVRMDALFLILDNAPSQTWTRVRGTEWFARVAPVDGGRQVTAVDKENLRQAVCDFYQTSFGAGLEVRVLLPGEVFAADAERPRYFATAPLAGALREWRIILIPTADSDLEIGSREQTVFYIKVGATVVAVILTISTLAGLALSRQLRLHELRTTALAAVAHELKTPVASTRALVETLLERPFGEDPEKLREYLELIALENRRLEQTIGSFLLLARMEQREYRFKYEPVAPEEILQEAVSTLKVQLEENQFTVRTHAEASCGPVQADRKALVTMLVNLIENAMKYSESTREVDLSVRRVRSGVVFEVADRGIGISPQDMKDIFEPFRQADDRLARTREGTGLGLSIVRNIARAHGGNAEVRLRPGGGTVFSVLIPFQPPRINRWIRR